MGRLGQAVMWEGMTTTNNPAQLIAIGEVALRRDEEEMLATGAPKDSRLGIEPPVALYPDEALLLLQSLQNENAVIYRGVTQGRMKFEGAEGSFLDVSAIAGTIVRVLTSEPLLRDASVVTRSL